jgi:F-type H+-transporting ATPase subunit a
MHLTPDSEVFAQWGFFKINATLVYTWVVMALLLIATWLATRKLTSDREITDRQNRLEVIVSLIRGQIRDLADTGGDRYLGFIGTLYLFIALSNLLSFVPGYEAPTSSLSTTGALALCVFCAVPIFGIAEEGLKGYLKHYVEPVFIMLPFRVISEVSRTIALAVRLFGNVASGSILAAILLSVTPLFFPVALRALELLIGQVQAFIFAVLATVYIASGRRAREEGAEPG